MWHLVGISIWEVLFMARVLGDGGLYWEDSDDGGQLGGRGSERGDRLYDLVDVVSRDDIEGDRSDWSSLSTERSSELLGEFHKFWREFSSFVNEYNRVCNFWDSLHDIAISIVESPEEDPYTVAVAVSILQTLAAAFAMLARSALQVSRASDVWHGALERHIVDEDERKHYMARAMLQKMVVMQDAIVKAATEQE
jgi:hypothetical protein